MDRTISWFGPAVGRAHTARWLRENRERAMHAESHERFRILNLSPKPAWAEVWHLRKIVIPRRSITGRLLTGQVWRRHDGRRWIYKKFTACTG
jgi:hypothetical protein